jgi:hypothetical protein
MVVRQLGGLMSSSNAGVTSVGVDMARKMPGANIELNWPRTAWPVSAGRIWIKLMPRL